MRLSGAHRAAVPVLLALAAAAVANLLVPTYPGYDTYANLVWGKALAGGMMPDLTERLAPTPHPLEILVGVVVSPFGAGDRIAVVLVIASFLALIGGMYAFARETVGRVPAILAALLVAVNPSLLVITVRGGADIPFLAVVAWALALAARPEPVAARRVLALLALGGLLRPEAWALAVVYAAYRLWRRRTFDAVEAGLAVAAPVAWALMDTALTGHPTHSLTWTTALAGELGRSRSATEAPVLLVKALAHLLTPPVLALSLLGGGMALATRDRLRLRIPAAMLVLGLCAYVAIVVGGFSAVDRYAWLAVLPLIVFAAYAVTGFTLEPDPARKRRWQYATAGVLAVGLAGLLVRAPHVDRVHRELVQEPKIHDRFAALLARPSVRAASHCGPVTVDGYYRSYEARWALDWPTAEVQPPPARPTQGGVVFSTVSDPRTLPAAVQATMPRVVAHLRRESVPGLSAYLACAPPARR
jgi:hypothetical protein